MAPPPDEERTTSQRKVNGKGEGVGGAIKEGVVDDTTVRQSEVARVNVVEAGVRSPPRIWCGWEGGTLSGGLGAKLTEQTYIR